MKIESTDGKFYRLISPPKVVKDWIKFTIEPIHRFYREGYWFVFEKHVEDLTQLASRHCIVDLTKVVDNNFRIKLQQIVNNNQTQKLALPLVQEYEILHLHPSAPSSILEVVWRALAKMHHPDKGGDAVVFKEKLKAYKKIKDSQ